MPIEILLRYQDGRWFNRPILSNLASNYSNIPIIEMVLQKINLNEDKQ